MFNSGAKKLFLIVLVLNGLAGLALVFVYSSSQNEPVVITQQVPAAPPPMAKVVVAKVPLSFGMELKDENLAVVDWPQGSVPEDTFSSLSELFEGAQRRVALRTIDVNEPLTKRKVSGFGGSASLSHVITPGMRAVAIRVNEFTLVGGFVLPGDRVDAWLTRPNPNGKRTKVTHLLLQNVRVLAVDQLTEGQANRPKLADSVTVELTVDQLQKVILAQQVGMITLALRNASPGAEEIKPKMADINALTPEWERRAPKRRVRKAAKPKPVDDRPAVTVHRGTHASNVKVEKDAVGTAGTSSASTFGQPGYGAGSYVTPRKPSPVYGQQSGPGPVTLPGPPAADSTLTGEPVRLVPPNYNSGEISLEELSRLQSGNSGG